MKKIINIIPKPIKSFLRPAYLFILKSPLGYLITPQGSRTQLHTYWRHPGDQHNSPEGYIGTLENSEFLLKLIKKYVNPQEKILEIGCNVGRNLNYLFGAGYKNLESIEISKEALDLMKKTYPQMASSVKIHNNSVEDTIKNFKDNSFDLVFTMAVLEHIHPDSEFIFLEMARITKKYLVTIESEKDLSWRHFPRKYKKVFETLGMRQIEQFNCKEIKDLGPNFWARVFKKETK